MMLLIALAILLTPLSEDEGLAKEDFKILPSLLNVKYQVYLSHPLEFFGYVGNGWEDKEELKLMKNDNANLVVVDFGWLGGFLLPDENDPRKARINLEHNRFEAFEKFLKRCENLGFKNLVGIITCTNFHEYPDWFRKLYPDIYAIDARGKPEPLLYEVEIPEEKKQFWTNVEHPVLNDLRKEFARRVIERFKGNKNILVWGIDGETLYPPVPAERGFDRSKFAIQHFRAYLREKYGDIKRLNKKWGTNYREFSEVLPPEKIAHSGANLDWHTFRLQAIADYLQYLYIAYKDADSVRLSFNWLHDMGLRDDELKISGCAPFKYALVGDGLIANPIVRPPREEYNTKYFEVMTSFGKPVFSSQLAYFPRPWPGNMIRRQIYECLGLGVWSVGLVTWSWPENYLINWGIKGTEGQEEARKVFSELSKLSPYLEQMWAVCPALRVFLSQPVWLMDGWKDSWDTLHKDFLERQIAKRYIFDEGIIRGELDIAKLKVLIALDQEIVAEGILRKIEDFIQKGGIFVIIGDFNTLNEELEKAYQPAFMKSLGPRKRYKGVEYRVGNFGKGKVLKIEGAYNTAVGDLLEEILKDVEGLQPVKIISTNPPVMAFKSFHDTTKEGQDLADDFSGHSSLGQIIDVPGEFVQSLLITTPTYWKKVKGHSLKMEVFLGGPGGEKIAERMVPPEEIKDNGWIEIIVGRKIQRGTKLYLRVSPNEPLPPETIGWWSLKVDGYGGAFADDKPVEEIIRRVQVNYLAEEETSKAVESFILSDGINLGVILVNTQGESFRVNFRVDKALIPDEKGEYIVKEPLKDMVLYEGRLMDGEISLTLEPYGTAVVILERKTLKDEVEKLLWETRKGLMKVKRKGGDISLGDVFYEKGEEFFLRGNYSKALAYLLKAKNLLYFSPINKVREKDGRMRISFKILDFRGEEVHQATVIPTVLPLFESPLPCTQGADGAYCVTIDGENLPKIYDYRKGEYLPYTGNLTVRINGRKGKLEGHTEIDI